MAALGHIMKQLFYIMVFVLIASCASVSKKDDHLVLEPGRYYKGDGLGVNIYIQLNADGTYESKWNGCLGNYGNASGRWLARENELIFLPEKEDGMLKGELRVMEVIIYKDKVGFIPQSDLNDHYKVLKEFGRSFYVYTLQKP